MLIDIGQGYKNLVVDEDFIEVMQEQISYEFAEEIARRLSAAEDEVEWIRADADSDSKYIEAENEGLRNLIDDVNSLLQCYLDPIERGKRINRQEMIKTLNKAIQMLSER